MKVDLKLVAMAAEWATELGRFKGHELLVADETLWGFSEVDRGRNPDIVLKEMLSKIKEKIEEGVSKTVSQPSGN